MIILTTASPRLNLRDGLVAADPRVGRRADLEDRPAGAPAATSRPNAHFFGGPNTGAGSASCSLVLAGALLACGCGPAVMAGFESAGRLASQQNKELLVFYESWLSPECSKMKLALDSANVRSRLGDKIYCVLDESYEPNQRIVAQYGISRFPSLILIHRDGTYHQHQGAMGAGAIVQFIDSSTAPGRRPRINPQIPRTVDYHWEADYERAFARAKRQDRTVFIFYKSVISADSNEMLAGVLNRSDVAGLFEGTINCLLDWGFTPNRRLMARYGVTNVPGIVIVNPDGTYNARQGRMTAAQVISFARGAIASARQAPTGR